MYIFWLYPIHNMLTIVTNLTKNGILKIKWDIFWLYPININQMLTK